MRVGFTAAQSEFLRTNASVAYTENVRPITDKAAFADIPGAHIFHVCTDHDRRRMCRFLLAARHPHPERVDSPSVVVLYAATIWVMSEPNMFSKVARLLTTFCSCKACRDLCVHWRRRVNIPSSLTCASRSLRTATTHETETPRRHLHRSATTPRQASASPVVCDVCDEGVEASEVRARRRRPPSSRHIRPTRGQ